MKKLPRPDDWRGRSWRERIIRAWPCAASAAMLLLAFPPFNLGFFVFFALIPWLMSLRDTSGREAWRSGYLFGFLFGLGQLFWVAQLAARWVHSLAMGILPWFIAAALYAIYFGWTAVLIRHAWKRNWLWAIPLVWAGIEVFRSFIPMFAFPYGLIATPLWSYTVLIQTAHIGTIYLVSAWVLLINLVIAMRILREEYPRVRLYSSVALAAVALSLVVLRSSAPTKPLVVTMGQPGVDMAFGTPESQLAGLAANVDAITARAEKDGTQLLVLPEGIADAPEEVPSGGSRADMPPPTVFRLSKKVPTIFGGTRGSDPRYQSAFAYDYPAASKGVGPLWQYVDKTRLVVFGEFVPGRTLLASLVRGYRLPDADLSPGIHGVQSVTLDGLKIGPIVCFEALFPDVSYRQTLNDVRLLAVIGIDDWFMDGNAPQQLRAASAWRAIETGLPVVRSTTSGYTLAYDGKGRIFAQGPLREPFGLRVQVPVPRGFADIQGLADLPHIGLYFCVRYAVVEKGNLEPKT